MEELVLASSTHLINSRFLLADRLDSFIFQQIEWIRMLIRM